ncbi:MAG: nicotinamide mononucleotide transporter [Paludibacteraceae bacterium]|nr:nicotinamide mononucleotide transporter [Paludibacteraceae bacterium]
MLSFLKREFIAGKTWFDHCFLAVGVLLQVVVYVLQPASPVLIVSGLAGVFSVVLTSQGRISAYLFGFIQVVTYIFICFEERLYAEVALNGFYFFSMIYGVFSWRRRYVVSESSEANTLLTRRLSAVWRVVLAVVAVAGSVLAALALERFTDDSQPWLDAFTTVPSIVAQLLMINRYREQWMLWIVVDMLAIWMWCIADNMSMAVLYAFWCCNCVYGYYNWKKTEQHNNFVS